MSAVLDFYGRKLSNPQGLSLADLLQLDNAHLEAAHDGIAWLFPLPERTALHPAAPLLTDGDIEAFHDDPALHAALEKSLARIRAFYGLPGLRVRQAHWLTPGNPHGSRLARVLRSLHLLGLEHGAQALLRDLEALYKAGAGKVIGAEMLATWRRAAQ